MKTRYIFLIALLNFIFQSTWLQFFRINGVLPNTSLILVVVFGALFGKREGLYMALFAGAFQDVFLSKILCINLLIYTVVAWIIGSFEESLFKDNFLTPLVITGVSTLSYHMIWMGIMYIFRSNINGNLIVKVLIMETVLNGIISVFIYGNVLKRLYGYGLR